MRYSLLLLFFLPFLSFGQTNLFDSIGSKWYTTSGYYITGQNVTINSMTYKELLRSGQPDFLNGEYVGAIRYETASSRVFFVPGMIAGMPNETEFLLYDFDVNLQDTVTVFNDLTGFSQPTRVQVNSLSTVTIGSQQYQKVGVEGVDQFYPYPPESWQFGTGSSFGVLNPGLTGVTIFDITYPTLICSELDTIYYHNPDFQTCINDLGISDVLLDQLNVYIRDHQIVVEGVEANKVQKADFVTLSGSRFPVRNIIPSDGGFRFDIPEQVRGLLFIQVLTTKNNWISSKVFVTD
ncbi:hypothetical protein [Fluviicola sp.]|uniref:hypothetical protein n=1 Tax=Fluviicola sp. TaxID=1917219 RepID=UPI0031DB76A7